MSTRCGWKFHYYIASVQKSRNRSGEIVKDSLEQQQPFDNEELCGFGESIQACPWFLGRAAAVAESCDILFILYNCLMDRHIRRSVDVDWANEVLIIGEANNLKSVL